MHQSRSRSLGEQTDFVSSERPPQPAPVHQVLLPLMHFDNNDSQIRTGWPSGLAIVSGAGVSGVVGDLGAQAGDWRQLLGQQAATHFGQSGDGAPFPRDDAVRAARQPPTHDSIFAVLPPPHVAAAQPIYGAVAGPPGDLLFRQALPPQQQETVWHVDGDAAQLSSLDDALGLGFERSRGGGGGGGSGSGPPTVVAASNVQTLQQLQQQIQLQQRLQQLQRMPLLQQQQLPVQQQLVQQLAPGTSGIVLRAAAGNPNQLPVVHTPLVWSAQQQQGSAPLQTAMPNIPYSYGQAAAAAPALYYSLGTAPLPPMHFQGNGAAGGGGGGRGVSDAAERLPAALRQAVAAAWPGDGPLERLKRRAALTLAATLSGPEGPHTMLAVGAGLGCVC